MCRSRINCRVSLLVVEREFKIRFHIILDGLFWGVFVFVRCLLWVRRSVAGAGGVGLRFSLF